MVSPMIEREEDNTHIVHCAEGRFYASPWASLSVRDVDAAHVSLHLDRASVSCVLTREEVLAVAEMLRRVADQIPVRVAA